MDTELIGNIDSLNTINTIDQITRMNPIHIRNQQRNTRKSITLVEGLQETIDLQLLAKKIRLKTHSAGVVKTSNGKKYLQFSGDQRTTIKLLLIEFGIANEEQIILHGCD